MPTVTLICHICSQMTFCSVWMCVKLCSGSAVFSRKHPLACWVASMLMCFATSIVSNFFVGESLVIPLKNHQEIIVASAVWYDLLCAAINHSLPARSKNITVYGRKNHSSFEKLIEGCIVWNDTIQYSPKVVRYLCTSCLLPAYVDA